MPYSDRKQNLGKRVKYFIVLVSPSRYRRSYLYVFKRQYGHMDIGVSSHNRRNNHDNIYIDTRSLRIYVVCIPQLSVNSIQK